jgi:hypothetical protein
MSRYIKKKRDPIKEAGLEAFTHISHCNVVKHRTVLLASRSEARLNQTRVRQMVVDGKTEEGEYLVVTLETAL